MRHVLHILTSVEDALPEELVRRERELPACQVELVDLAQPEPDYERLLDKIFAADSVQVW